MGKIVISEMCRWTESSRIRPVTRALGAAAGSAGSRTVPQVGKLALDEALGAGAFLLGRRSY